jgi:putative addiction module component (TIGR02574 family)
MTNYESVFSAACQLPDGERLRLISALWDTVPEDAEMSLSPEWLAEIDRRLEELDRDPSRTTPWAQVRDEALARLLRGQSH